MSTRRDFLNLTIKGSAMTAAAAVLPRNPYALLNRGDSRSMNMNDNATSSVHYKLPFKFGLGGVPLGNEFAVVTDKDAYAILEAAWSAGIRYYDVSPWYGLGLAERRFGSFLHNKNRSEYVVSSKVGKLLKASKTAKGRELFPFSPSPNEVIFDYTASGVRRSIEDSLQRLGVDSLDIVFVHDLSSDNKLLPTSWQEQSTSL
jgi:D-threo-aldose 1-dehydrogenase